MHHIFIVWKPSHPYVNQFSNNWIQDPTTAGSSLHVELCMASSDNQLLWATHVYPPYPVSLESECIYSAADGHLLCELYLQRQFANRGGDTPFQYIKFTSFQPGNTMWDGVNKKLIKPVSSIRNLGTYDSAQLTHSWSGQQRLSLNWEWIKMGWYSTLFLGFMNQFSCFLHACAL